MYNMVTHFMVTMKFKIIVTDHNQHELDNGGNIINNDFFKLFGGSGLVDALITVSHAVRENAVVRSCYPPERIFPIPNSIDSSSFKPDPSLRNPLGTINLVYMARLEYRKGKKIVKEGTDLLVQLIPWICKKYPNAYWIIGGNGNLGPIIKACVDKYELNSRVELLGFVKHENVGKVLNRGQIFINTSLTEAFCISALEAACTGLKVVTTNVGGTPEILPPDMLVLSNPDPIDFFQKLCNAIDSVDSVDANQFHLRVKKYYSWRKIAEMTDKVYRRVYEMPKRFEPVGYDLLSLSKKKVKI